MIKGLLDSVRVCVCVGECAGESVDEVVGVSIWRGPSTPLDVRHSAAPSHVTDVPCDLWDFKVTIS